MSSSLNSVGVPVVSVLVPLYNCAPYLEKCLSSLTEQTLQNIEIIISDDGSTDGSAAIARQFAEKDPRVHFHQQPQNIGLLRNYNFLFTKARGEYIAIQDADDWTDLDRLEKQVAILKARPELVIVGCQAFFHYPDGKKNPPDAEQSHEVESIGEIFPSVPASIVFPREKLTKTAVWHPFFEGGTSMDRYFIMELLEGEKGWHMAEPLYHARIHATSNHRTFNIRKVLTGILFQELLKQRIATGTDWLKEGNLNAIKEWEASILANRLIMSEKYREYAMYQLDGNNQKDAYDYIKKALSLNPFSVQNYKTLLYYFRKKFGKS